MDKVMLFYPVPATSQPVSVGDAPVCGQKIANFRFDEETSIDKATELILKINEQYLIPRGKEVYGLIAGGGHSGGSNGSTLKANSIELTSYSSKWPYQTINAVPTSGNRVRVAVLDTGVSNPLGTMQIDTSSAANFLTLDPNTYEPTTNAEDDFIGGHGTGIAALIADENLGVAPGATIIPVKVCNNEGVGGLCDNIALTRGICYANSQSAQVINVSFYSMLDTPMFQQAIREVTAAGSLVVTAAGNTLNYDPPYVNAPVYPASWTEDVQGLVSVGAIDQDLNYADFATANASVELVAPGSDLRVDADHDDPIVESSGIEVYTPTGEPIYVEGASFAAPFVSGTAAAMYAQCSSNTPAITEQILQNTATPWSDQVSEGQPLPSDFSPVGLVNFEAALSASCVAVSEAIQH